MSKLLRLIAVASLLLVVWGVILPRLSSTAAMKQRLRWLDDHGIEPSAMFYTELPRMMPETDE